MVGLGGFEPPTSPLSGVRSNQLSYRPKSLSAVQLLSCLTGLYLLQHRLGNLRGCSEDPGNFFKGGDPAAGSPTATLLRLHPSHESQSGERPPEG